MRLHEAECLIKSRLCYYCWLVYRALPEHIRISMWFPDNGLGGLIVESVEFDFGNRNIPYLASDIHRGLALCACVERLIAHLCRNTEFPPNTQELDRLFNQAHELMCLPR